MGHENSTYLQRQIDKLSLGDLPARDELIRHTGERLQHLTRKILQDFRRVRKFEETGDVPQNAILRMLRRLQNSPPATVIEFFQLAAREIRAPSSLSTLKRRWMAARMGLQAVLPDQDA